MTQQILKSPLIDRAMPQEPAFRLFIACEDNASFLNARKLEEQVRELCSDEIKFSRVFWSFSLLRNPNLRKYAVKEAAEADMIILSIDGRSSLSDDVKALLEGLPVRSRPGQAALVTLIDCKSEESQGLEELVPFLRRLAQSHGLDFFCNRNEWDRFEPDAKSTRAARRAVAPAGMLSCHIPWNAGGLND